MREVSWTLRKTLSNVWQQIYERRGEALQCQGCALRLVCFMKYVGAYTEHFWCTRCAGLVYKEERLIVRCRAFAPRELVRHAIVRKEYCPNCWNTGPDFKDYRIVQNNFHNTNTQTDR